VLSSFEYQRDAPGNPLCIVHEDGTTTPPPLTDAAQLSVIALQWPVHIMRPGEGIGLGIGKACALAVCDHLPPGGSR
jgi:hypothetical protein